MKAVGLQAMRRTIWRGPRRTPDFQPASRRAAAARRAVPYRSCSAPRSPLVAARQAAAPYRALRPDLERPPSWAASGPWRRALAKQLRPRRRWAFAAARKLARASAWAPGSQGRLETGRTQPPPDASESACSLRPCSRPRSPAPPVCFTPGAWSRDRGSALGRLNGPPDQRNIAVLRRPSPKHVPPAPWRQQPVASADERSGPDARPRTPSSPSKARPDANRRRQTGPPGQPAAFRKSGPRRRTRSCRASL